MFLLLHTYSCYQTFRVWNQVKATTLNVQLVYGDRAQFLHLSWQGSCAFCAFPMSGKQQCPLDRAHLPSYEGSKKAPEGTEPLAGQVETFGHMHTRG